MRIGWVGLGKLGLTCAAVLADQGHDVAGYDVSGWPADALDGRAPLPDEQGFADLDVSRLRIVDSPASVVAAAEVVFVAVQTPHAPEYGGESPMPETRKDFEYGYLSNAVRAVCAAADQQQRDVTVVIVSTVLPGTINKHIRPLLNGWVSLVYNPFFIAMGTTIADMRKPEFVLLGTDRPGDAEAVMRVYRGLHDAPFATMSIESAELTKVAYNTFISVKIVWANAIMEICHKTGADSDQIVDALELATDRVISSRYMSGGMGDGGHCHPRDLIAMSWLGLRLDLSYDLFGAMARARDAQSGWLADLVVGWRELTGLGVTILGRAYKPGTALTGGSPAYLLFRQIVERLGDELVQITDPHIDGPVKWTHPRVFVVATRHPEFAEAGYPPGSVVIDPWGYIADQPRVTVVRVGRKT